MTDRSPGRPRKPKPSGYQRTKTVYVSPDDWHYWQRAQELVDRSGGRVSLSSIVGRGIRRAVTELERREDL